MGPSFLLMLLVALVVVPVAVLLVIYVLVPFFKALGWIIRRILAFLGGELADIFRLIGGVITAIVYVPLVLANIVIGRWSAASHFGRAIQSEFASLGAAAYRILIGHPARLFCLTALTEGLEKRVPEALAAAPGPDRPSRGRAGRFEGYEIVGSLRGGGSGGRLYVARPDAMKRAALARSGHAGVDLCVIKAFDLADGSSLPQIVRESRALEAAREMDLVLEHDLSDDRFFYVMRYVPGDPLSVVTQRLHAESPPGGLGPAQLALALAYSIDLLRTLDAYHRGGLWHKDVKPDNIIIDGARAHLVDLGLITPLRSALTLTTHGTEYFRDPELVRLALRGVKVHQVDGARFDVYGVGAVLYSVIENSFPAHGALSQIEKRCPEALKWVIRRAMADYDKRYPSAHAMLADLEVIAGADDPATLRPADLPSMSAAGMPAPGEATLPRDPDARAVPHPPPPAPATAPGTPPSHAARRTPLPRERPRISVTNWWTGAFRVEQPRQARATPPRSSFGGFKRARSVRAVGAVPSRAPVLRGHPLGLTAKEQVERARERAAAAGARARVRTSARRAPRPAPSPAGINAGVVFALAIGLLVALGAISLLTPARIQQLATAQEFEKRTDEARDASDAFVSAPDPALLLLQRVHNALLNKRILVIKDAELSPKGEETVRRAIEGLERAGVHVDGDFTSDPGGILGERLIDVTAAAREVRGLAPVDSEDVTIALANWLDRSEGVDIILWVTRKRAHNPDVPAYHAIGRARDSSAVLAGYLRAVAEMSSAPPAP